MPLSKYFARELARRFGASGSPLGQSRAQAILDEFLTILRSDAPEAVEVRGRMAAVVEGGTDDFVKAILAVLAGDA